MEKAVTAARHDSKMRILDAAVEVIRAKGYPAMRIEDVCAAAGLTKGSFFHHFATKEDLAVSAAEYWGEVTTQAFASAPYRAIADPLERLLAYVDFRKALMQGELSQYTCLAGTMVQDVYQTHPAIRDACDRTISEHAVTVEADIAEAIHKYGVKGDWSAKSLALYTQAVIQGAFILAKAKQGPEAAVACVDHLRRYLEMLFAKPETKEEMSCQPQQ
jgi:TetR/AcrR family transcriptional regulator, transcriptional repressor for nem operon